MNTNEYLLTCLAEECAEIQQAISKALRFGLSDGHPDKKSNNAEDISQEIIDLMAVVELCQERGIINIPEESEDWYEDKMEKMEEFMNYAKKQGTLSD